MTGVDKGALKHSGGTYKESLVQPLKGGKCVTSVFSLHTSSSDGTDKYGVSVNQAGIKGLTTTNNLVEMKSEWLGCLSTKRTGVNTGLLPITFIL